MTAHTIHKEGKSYPVFLVMATQAWCRNNDGA
jgi:hypothetical protein